MPTKNRPELLQPGQRGKDTPSQFGDASFVNLELTKEQRITLRMLAKSDEYNLAEVLQELVGKDYRLTFKFDARDDCWAVFMQPLSPEHPNGRLILTGRGGTCHSALSELAYKHLTLLGTVWPRDQQKRRDRWWEEVD